MMNKALETSSAIIMNKKEFVLKKLFINMNNACSDFARKLKCQYVLDLETFSLDSDRLGKFPLELITIVYLIITVLLYKRFEPILIYFIVRLCSALACRIDLSFLFKPNQGENVIV